MLVFGIPFGRPYPVSTPHHLCCSSKNRRFCFSCLKYFFVLFVVSCHAAKSLTSDTQVHALTHNSIYSTRNVFLPLCTCECAVFSIHPNQANQAKAIVYFSAAFTSSQRPRSHKRRRVLTIAQIPHTRHRKGFKILRTNLYHLPFRHTTVSSATIKPFLADHHSTGAGTKHGSDISERLSGIETHTVKILRRTNGIFCECPSRSPSPRYTRVIVSKERKWRDLCTESVNVKRWMPLARASSVGKWNP